MSFLELKLLGGLSISLDGKPLSKLKSQKGQALLCYLAVTHKSYSRSTLAGLFWGDMPESNALMNLRKALSRMKPLSPYLSISRDTLAFTQDMPYWLDVDEFLQAAAEADPDRLQYASSLYRGDFLDGFEDCSPMFGDWMMSERQRLRERVLVCLHNLVKNHSLRKDYPAAISSLRQILTIEPWQEDAHRELMRLLVLSGQRIEALLQYKTCQGVLSREFGIEPDDATIRLYEQIKTNNLGEKVVQNEQQISIPGIFFHDTLPAQTTPFIGREREMAILQEYLADPGVRLVTILGPGGIGKTRLALAAAHQQSAERSGSAIFTHGITFISLAGVESPDLLLPAIAGSIALRFTGGEDPVQQLLQFLRHKKMLLVMDNYEHLLAGTGLIDEILRTAPGIKLLITTRERLNRQSEFLLTVGGMDYPRDGLEVAYTARVLAQYSAIQLFEQTARRVQPDFVVSVENKQAVLGICQLVHGMPLGIVLAAAWIEMLPPQEILDEMNRDLNFLKTGLGDVPDRQRSLRAAFDYSWRRLAEKERRIFRQLSVFRGGFTYQAAQEVVGASLVDLQKLVNKSLITRTNTGRYDIHELLRQFAAEELADDPVEESGVHQRHSAFYCAFLQEHTQNWHNERQLKTLAAMTAEEDNVQAAWHWAASHDLWPQLNMAIDSWGCYHLLRGRLVDGESLFKAASDRARRQASSIVDHDPDCLRLWAKALAWQGRFSFSRISALQTLRDALSLLERPGLSGQDTRREKAFIFYTCALHYNNLDRKKAREYLELGLALYRELGDSWGIGVSLVQLGNLDWGTGRYPAAMEKVQDGLAILNGLGDMREQILAKDHLSWIYKHQGRLNDAEQLRRETVNLSQQLHDRDLLINTTADLAYVLWWQGKLSEMRQWAETCLEMVMEYALPGWEGYARLALCTAWLEIGQYEKARQEAILSLSTVQKNNDHGVEATVHFMLGRLALIRESQSEAQAEFNESYRLYREVQDNLLGFALAGQAMMAGVFVDLQQARRYAIEALQNAWNLHDSLLVWTILPGIALYLARTGEAARAVKVWALANGVPLISSSQWFADVIGARVESEAETLPLETVDSARSRGRESDLWQTAGQLLAELSAG